jgi:hypothetical protein
MEIKLSNERYEEIKRIVVNMLIFYGIFRVPISGFEIACKMGVKVIPYSAFPPEKRTLLFKESKDGFTVQKDTGEWFIYYNDNCDYGRINNTIMHEIGHIVLDHTQDSELAEKEVKFFAKYALVPPVLVYILDLGSPQQISEIFKVSFEAACYAFNYYRKWLYYGGNCYKDYELLLIERFNEAV